MRLLYTLFSIHFITVVAAFGAVNVYDSASNIYYLESSTDIDLTGGSGNFYFDFLDDGTLPSSTSDTKLILNTSSTYTFTHVGSGHPFIILSDSVMADFNPNFTTGLRDSFPATLQERAAYDTVSGSLYLVANIEDSFTWSPSADDVGSYWYTCAIAGHRDFLGQIDVVAVPEPSNYAILLGSLGICLVALRRR